MILVDLVTGTVSGGVFGSLVNMSAAHFFPRSESQDEDSRKVSIIPQ